MNWRNRASSASCSSSIKIERFSKLSCLRAASRLLHSARSVARGDGIGNFGDFGDRAEDRVERSSKLVAARTASMTSPPSINASRRKLMVVFTSVRGTATRRSVFELGRATRMARHCREPDVDPTVTMLTFRRDVVSTSGVARGGVLGVKGSGDNCPMPLADRGDIESTEVIRIEVARGPT